jgi:hypothetical protein
MNKKFIFSLTLGLIMVMIVSCQPLISNNITATPVESNDWWTAWLGHPVCQVPCWQNITPGVTTRDDAMIILQKTPDVVSIYNGTYGISWYFGAKTEAGDITLSTDEKVELIWLENSSSKEWYLERVVASYGFPKYVQPYDCRDGMCLTALVYPDMGIALSVFVENKGNKDNLYQIEIRPDLIVDRVFFIERGIDNFLKLPGFQDTSLLMDWKGYGNYP